MDKRQFAITVAGGLLTAALLPGFVLAQEKYPSKPVTLLVPFPPGGVADIVARSLAPALEKKWGQSVVVVNRPGAGGALGTGQLVNARPDGYTLLVALASVSTNPEQERINKRPAAFQLNQLMPVARLSMDQMMLAVRAESKYKNLRDLLNDARAQPGKISYASSGVYGVYHVATSMFTHAAGVNMNHIPYNGGPPALMALLSGDVDVSLVTRSVGLPHLQSGKLRGLAAWGSEKWSDFPSVPSLKEQGFDADYQLWSGLFAPAGTPGEVVNVLRDAVRGAMEDPQFKASLLRQQASSAYMDTPEFQKYWAEDAKRLIDAVQKIGPTN
jgi:tripartite-type tricarboxylate transporter receptor subunit TctC